MSHKQEIHLSVMNAILSLIIFICIVLLLQPTETASAEHLTPVNTPTASMTITKEAETNVTENYTEIVATEETSVEELETIELVEDLKLEAPEQSSFKSFTYYTALAKNTPQGRLQEIAYTDANGLRKVDDAYCVALGTYYGTEIGARYVITLDSGKSFEAVLCDVKSDRHTDATHRFTVATGCAVEFYVDPNSLNGMVRRMGDVSAIPEFAGEVVSIQLKQEDKE